MVWQCSDSEDISNGGLIHKDIIVLNYKIGDLKANGNEVKLTLITDAVIIKLRR